MLALLQVRSSHLRDYSPFGATTLLEKYIPLVGRNQRCQERMALPVVLFFHLRSVEILGVAEK